MRKSVNNGRNKKIILIAIAAFMIIIFSIYLGFSFYFKKHFFFRTEINGLKVGGMTIAEAEQKLSDEVDQYLLTVYDRDNEIYYVKGSEIGCKYISDNSVGRLLKEQNVFAWPKLVFELNAAKMGIPMEYNKTLLKQAVADLPLFQQENVIQPQNAYISQEDNNFLVVPEAKGTQAVLKKVVATIEAAVDTGEIQVHLDDSHYKNPKVTTESNLIKETMATLDTYLSTRITYKVKEKEEVLGRDKIIDFITFNEDYDVIVNETKIEEYVQYLASKYNTYADEREFKTSKGDNIIIGGGDYGWIVDKEKEARLIKEDILSGGSVTREPAYLQRAVVEGANDIGNTYLEIDYTNQHMWYYVKGALMMESDIVTGNISKNWGSPDGVFKIVYKKSPDVLKGEDYESDVAYFMPFAYNVGVHDAEWRPEFGGEIYKTQGSHGCINAPFEKAEVLYKAIEVGTPVIAYYREPVELTAENTRIANAYSYVKPKENQQ